MKKEMDVKKVRIIFNDDGTDSYRGDDGEEVEFGDLRENALAIKGALDRLGIEARLTPLTKDSLDEFISALGGGDEDMIFNLCEAAFNNSALEMNVAALLELYGARFTGSGSLTLGVALNKGWTKDILRGAGVPTPEHMVVEDYPVELEEHLSFPLIVKPVSEDASCGIQGNSVVWTEDELNARVEEIVNEYYQGALIEEYIDGREFNISVIGNYDTMRALPASEIDFSELKEGLPRICCYEAKWVESSPQYIRTPPVCPANISEELAEQLSEVALYAYEAMGCRDYARVDMRMAPDGRILVLEVNPNPDISLDAGLVRAAQASGLEFHDLIAAILKSAAARYLEEDACFFEDDDGTEGSRPDETGADVDREVKVAGEK